MALPAYNPLDVRSSKGLALAMKSYVPFIVTWNMLPFTLTHIVAVVPPFPSNICTPTPAGDGNLTLMALRGLAAPSERPHTTLREVNKETDERVVVYAMDKTSAHGVPVRTLDIKVVSSGKL